MLPVLRAVWERGVEGSSGVACASLQDGMDIIGAEWTVFGQSPLFFIVFPEIIQYTVSYG